MNAEEEKEEENKFKIDVGNAILTVEQDLENDEKNRLDEDYINFPSSQPEAIALKRYSVVMKDISDADESNTENESDKNKYVKSVENTEKEGRYEKGQSSG